MIQQTEDYNIFKLSPHNRELKERNINKLIRSLKAKNLLRNRPILVDKEMNIVDGQHRLEAAKRLNIPIWYEVQEDLVPEDIIRLNDNAKMWENIDYLKFHVEKGNVEYIKLQSFITEHGLSLATAFAILGLKFSAKRKNSDGQFIPHPFKAGMFQFPPAINLAESVEILIKSKEIIDYIKPKLDGNNKYLEGPHFRRALYVFLSIRSVDFSVFMTKLPYRIDLIRPCSRLADFINILKQIYNFHNRNPITVDDIN